MIEEKETVIDASAAAAAKAKEAQEAVEHARAVQAEEFENRHLERMEQVLRKIFPEYHSDDDAEMRIYLPRIPLLCTEVKTIKTSIEKVEDYIKILTNHITELKPILSEYQDKEATKRTLAKYKSIVIGSSVVIGAWYIIKTFIQNALQ